MAEKVHLDTLSTDLRTVIKSDNGHTLPQATGLWNDASLLSTRPHRHVQPSASDLRMVVRIQRKNKHPHSTKKHK